VTNLVIHRIFKTPTYEHTAWPRTVRTRSHCQFSKKSSSRLHCRFFSPNLIAEEALEYFKLLLNILRMTKFATSLYYTWSCDMRKISVWWNQKVTEKRWEFVEKFTRLTFSIKSML